ncbi:MAG TPA: hypothetical protein VJ733_03935 [Candidatus Binatia bacterium]|uniref:CD-NTase-associated protein 12/Pycsar effector protein TIR domain-containing protein n=1 Tax=Candidatus Muproteobacteria bacterium RBG_16_60_9 TaxID=1817755 RepID=A0A1F6UZ61_9PROT|nr:MAG: hypothetical protein A2W18_02755 [Candidatus Muproteobacteria bacterium RBG_16_60_9]HJX09633.1 hypothetical protein [Candidatus Binatia bacterium]
MAQIKTAKPAQKSTRKTAPQKVEDKRVYFKQTDFPQTTLQQAQKIASALVDNFASDSGSPPDVALAIGISPTSSGWQSLAGASIAYGLTDGGINANVMKLTTLGRRLVAPEAEGEDIVARREAILKPRILREFFEKYRRAKLPNETIAANVLKSLGLPADRAETALGIIKVNGGYAGIIRETPTGPFINLDSPGVPSPVATPDLSDLSNTSQPGDTPAGLADGIEATSGPKAPAVAAAFDAKTNRVFISHGKQRAIVAQIKELLTFGSFEPVISVERESRLLYQFLRKFSKTCVLAALVYYT